jgi:hypothetical protein
MRRLAIRIENALVEIGEQPRRAGIVGRDAAAQSLNNFAAWRGARPERTAGAAVKNLLRVDVKPDAAFFGRGGSDSHE